MYVLSLLPDPAKVASLHRFASMLESLLEHEDQLCSDGKFEVWPSAVHVILMLNCNMNMLMDDIYIIHLRISRL